MDFKLKLTEHPSVQDLKQIHFEGIDFYMLGLGRVEVYGEGWTGGRS